MFVIKTIVIMEEEVFICTSLGLKSIKNLKSTF